MCALDALRTSVTIRIGCWLNEQLGPAYLACAVRGRLNGEASGAEFLRDISQIQNFIATQGLTAFFDAPWVPIFVGLIWILHPLLGGGGGRLGRGAVPVEHRQRVRHAQGERDGEPEADRGDAAGRCDDPQRRDRAGHAHVARHDRTVGGRQQNGSRRPAPIRRRRRLRARRPPSSSVSSSRWRSWASAPGWWSTRN